MLDAVELMPDGDPVEKASVMFDKMDDDGSGELTEDEFIKVGSADKILVCVHFPTGLLPKYLFLHRVAWQMRSSWIC